MPRPHLAASALAAALAVLASASAEASTFCVPDYSAACPNNGTNLKLGSLETAMQANQADGVKDTIHVAAGVLTDPDTFATGSGGTDALEIIGAGTGATVLTSASSANAYVVNVEPGSRAVTMRDLTIRVPATMPAGGGAAAQVRGATLDRVDVEVRNTGGDGISFVAGGTIRDGRVYAAAGGAVGDAIKTNGAAAGPLTVERMRIDAPSWGVVADSANVPVTVRRTTITTPQAYAVRVSGGGVATMENSLITSTTASVITAEATAGGSATFTGDHLTLVGLAGQTSPALTATVGSGVTNAATVVVKNSIIRGFTATYARSAPVGIALGNASIALQYANFKAAGTSTGDGAVTSTAGIDADPQFTGTGAEPYRLKTGSPSVDAGNPAAGGLADDLAGAARPADGDGDGTARRDMGAYELQPTPSTTPDPGPAPGDGGGGAPPGPAVPTTTTTPPADPGAADPPHDTAAPRLTGLRVTRALTHRRGGTLRFRLSEPARVQLRFTRTVAGRTRRVTLTVRGRAGMNTVKVARRKLAAARWRLTAVATDAAGNRTTTRARAVRVRR